MQIFPTTKRILKRIGAHLLAERVSGFALWMNGGKIINSSGNTLFVDHRDLQARQLFLRRGSLDARVIRTWNHLCNQLKPTLLIDIGANYGEVSLSRRYDGTCDLHLVEANPALQPFLRRSLALFGHPRATLHAGAATDRSGEALLFVDAGYSGMSSLNGQGAAISVPCFRIDERLRAPDHARLLFKIDIEGHERPALVGMANLLSRVKCWVGICEAHLSNGETLDYIFSNFEVRLIDKRLSFPPAFDKPTLVRAMKMRDRPYAKDVLLLPRGAGLADVLAPEGGNQ